MMFDWDDQEQVAETIWGEFNENEDHIVPFTKETEGNPIFSFEARSKKQKSDDTNTAAQSIEQSSGAKNAFPDCAQGNRSSIIANDDHSCSKLEMDTWPDLPTLNTELSTGELSSLNKSFSSLASGTMQLDGGSEFFSNAHREKENSSFLDCDWANIDDFDDLDKIFRNESIFGHDLVTNVDELLSSSADMIGNTMQSIPMPEIPLSRKESSEQGGTSFQSVEHSGGKRKAEDETADTVDTGDQTFHQTTHSNQLIEKDERKKKLLKSRKKAEERSKNKASQILNVPWPQIISQNQPFIGQNVPPFVMAPSQTILSSAIGQQSKATDVGPVENIGPSAQFMYPQYGYLPYPFPGIPMLQHIQADRSGNSEVSIGHHPYPDPLKYPNSSSVALEAQSRPLAMTPQEKIEKLRRRQQAQAMLAIQQQQQQFGHQVIGAENIAPHGNKIQDASDANIGVEDNGNKLPPSAQNLIHEHDGSQRISTSADENLLEKTIYYQLQDALRKLDIKVRLCIRDSLFRLARSSMERQNASDRSSTNISAKDERDFPVSEEPSGRRPSTLPDVETYTNPIDRTVAHLLFHRPLESCTRPVNDETPQSPALQNPVSKPPVIIHGSISEAGPEGFRELELQHSESK